MGGAMRYDPEAAPDPEKWLALDETQQIELVSAYHRRLGAKLPNDHLHAAIHVIVENQLARKVEVKGRVGPTSGRGLGPA